MSAQLCLSWNNHSTSFNKLLNSIYMQDLYSDGTIICQGKFYPVHSFVLSTCSEYFEEIFHQCMRMNNKHPFIIIKDITPDQMTALLMYMYKGEVNVSQEMLPDLMQASEALKVKGLAIPDEEFSTSKSTKKRQNTSLLTSVSKKTKLHKETATHTNKIDSSTREVIMSEISSHITCDEKSDNTKSEEIFIDDLPPITEIKNEILDYQDQNSDAEVSHKLFSSTRNEQDYNNCNEDDFNLNSITSDPLYNSFEESQECISWNFPDHENCVNLLPNIFSNFVIPLLEGETTLPENTARIETILIKELIYHLDSNNLIVGDSDENRRGYSLLGNQFLTAFPKCPLLYNSETSSKRQRHPFQNVLKKISNRRRQAKFHISKALSRRLVNDVNNI